MDEEKSAGRPHCDEAVGSTDANDAALAIRDIARRLSDLPVNPVIRARAWVEREVPEERRGPGWERHWRELEAYAESAGIWSERPE